jgi:dTDP-4-dehydrorhamnose 3,5-epimerase
MKSRELAVQNAVLLLPTQRGDDRGTFLEFYRHEALTEAVGHRLDLRQGNCSVSRAGTVRGIHYADVPPGQAKYVTCVRGAILDVVVDLRVGSPTFGRWDAVRLDDRDRAAVYVAEGLGHGFVALTEGATVMYLCSEVYDPAAEHGIDPLDPALAIDWGVADPLLSPKDAAAPTLAEAWAGDLLPGYEACQAYYASLQATVRI